MPSENLVLSDTIVTRVAGYRYHAAGPPTPGAPVQFVREPQNPHDPNAIAICSMDGGRLGYVFREIAEEYAALVDRGCVKLCGRMAEPGEPDHDPVRERSNPVLYVWIYADEARLDAVCAGPVAVPPLREGAEGSTAMSSD